MCYYGKISSIYFTGWLTIMGNFLYYSNHTITSLFLKSFMENATTEATSTVHTPSTAQHSTAHTPSTAQHSTHTQHSTAQHSRTAMAVPAVRKWPFQVSPPQGVLLPPPSPHCSLSRQQCKIPLTSLNT